MSDPHANPPDPDEVAVSEEVSDELWRPHLYLREQAQIVKVDGNWVWLDIGSKFESKLPLSNWTDEGEMPVVGDVVYFSAGDQIDPTDVPMHVARFTVRDTPRFPFEKMLGTLQVGDVAEGRMIREMAEGFLVRVEGGWEHGVLAFCWRDSASLARWNEQDSSSGSTKWRFVEIDRSTPNVRVEPA